MHRDWPTKACHIFLTSFYIYSFHPLISVSQLMMSLKSKMCFFILVAANKVKLVESGCLDVILPLLSTQSPFVQFKVLGTLRMLLTGQG